MYCDFFQMPRPKLHDRCRQQTTVVLQTYWYQHVELKLGCCDLNSLLKPYLEKI